MKSLRLSLFALLLLAVLGLSQDAAAEDDEVNVDSIEWLDSDGYVIDYAYEGAEHSLEINVSNPKSSAFNGTIVVKLEKDGKDFQINYEGVLCCYAELNIAAESDVLLHHSAWFYAGTGDDSSTFEGTWTVNITIRYDDSEDNIKYIYNETTIDVIVRTPKFIIGDIWFDKRVVLEGESLTITAKIWNEGTMASGAKVNFYVTNESAGILTSTQILNLGMLKVLGQADVDMVKTKTALENEGVYQTWYYATWTWWNVAGESGAALDTSYFFTNSLLENVTIHALVSQGGLPNEAETQRIDNLTASNKITIVKSPDSYSLDCISGSSKIKFGMSSGSEDGTALDCSDTPEVSFSLFANEDGSGVWNIQISELEPLYSVHSSKWKMLGPTGGNAGEGFLSDIYGHYAGHGKGIIYIDSDFNGLLSTGDKFEIYPGDVGSFLESVGNIEDYTFLIELYSENPALTNDNQTADTTEETTTESGDKEEDAETDYTMIIAGVGAMIAASILAAAFILRR